MKKKVLFLAMLAIAAAAGWMASSDNVSALADLMLNKVKVSAWNADCNTIAGSCWMDTSKWYCCDAGDFGCSPCGDGD